MQKLYKEQCDSHHELMKQEVVNKLEQLFVYITEEGLAMTREDEQIYEGELIQVISDKLSAFLYPEAVGTLVDTKV